MDRVYTPTAAEREELREPRGTVVQGDGLAEELRDRSYDRLIAVGDRVSLDLVDWSIPPDIAVVDGKIQREPIDQERLETVTADIHTTVSNPAGGVATAAWTAVREAVARTCTSRVIVDGEEDLLALPAVAMAAPGSVIVYGQRGTGAVILHAGETAPFVEQLVGRRSYGRVVVGGSWDRLHAGHRSLLLSAFARGSHVDMGVTTDSYMAQKLDHHDYQSYDRRYSAMEKFLERFGVADRATITPIDGVHGTAVDRGDAILVTADTLDGARDINEERERQGKEPLDVLQVPLLTAVDGGPVSSSRIRKGEIDRDGRPVNS
ncbi:MAG: pantetheine-phosphate adenylyltransferase [Candidatus Nanohaloarchaea archaeon]|nr:pantetheine-phosphate adenylyltransferase [Candidatus Nanohaloarchaea archaeon]